MYKNAIKLYHNMLKISVNLYFLDNRNYPKIKLQTIIDRQAMMGN